MNRKQVIKIKLHVSWQGRALMHVAKFTRNWLFLPVDVQQVIETIVQRHVWITLPSGRKRRLSEIGNDFRRRKRRDDERLR